MAEEGVTPLDMQPQPTRRTRPSATPAPTPPARPLPSKATQDRIATLEAALGAAQARTGKAEAARVEAQARATALEAERAAARDRIAALEAERADLQTQNTTLDAERRGLQRLLSTAPAAPPPAQPLPALLTRRGVAPDEHADALLLLLAERPHALLDALRLAPDSPLGDLLDQRLILTCGVADCAPLDGASALIVSAPRCEICGGSDATRAFHGFAAACLERAVRNVVIVGGSPAYRRTLKTLAAPRRSTLRVELVNGRSKPREQKIRGLARSADLVIIWCATILDHATTNAFEAADAPILRLPHRGIATMLQAAATALQSGRWKP